MTIPYVIERTSQGERSMDIYSRLLEDRIVVLHGEVNSASANVVVAQLLYLSAKDSEAPVTMYIDSPGGSVTAGLSIVDTMNYIKCPVHTICTGFAASMGAVVFSSGEKGSRLILPHAQVLIHQPLIAGGGLTGQCSDIQIHAEQMIKTRETLEELLSEATGRTREEIHSACDRDNYFSAEQAVQFGLCDRIITKQAQ